jgi:hypothetical protein
MEAAMSERKDAEEWFEAAWSTYFWHIAVDSNDRARFKAAVFEMVAAEAAIGFGKGYDTCQADLIAAPALEQIADLSERNRRQAAEILAFYEQGGAHRYPHMCRDGHDEVGWRGEGEQCPVCKLKAHAEHVANELDHAVRVGDGATFSEGIARCDTCGGHGMFFTTIGGESRACPACAGRCVQRLDAFRAAVRRLGDVE